MYILSLLSPLKRQKRKAKVEKLTNVAYRSLVAVSSDNSAANSAIPKRQSILKDAKLVQLTPVEATMNMPCLGMSYANLSRQIGLVSPGSRSSRRLLALLRPCNGMSLANAIGMNVPTFSSPTPNA
jgi:hypothetical protein